MSSPITVHVRLIPTLAAMPGRSAIMRPFAGHGSQPASGAPPGTTGEKNIHGTNATMK